MSILDIFNDDAFSLVSMTDAVNALPPMPSFLKNSGIFTDQPVNTTIVSIEEKDGLLSLVNTKQRGERGTSLKTPGRRMRHFSVPHIPLDDGLLADDLQGVRAFGTENRLEAFSEKVNEIQAMHKETLEATTEYHRVGALKGEILDADGSTIYNLFDEFGVTEDVYDFVFSVATTDIKQVCLNIIRQMKRDLGRSGQGRVQVTCLAGNGFFDALTSHATVKDAYNRYRDNEHARVQQFQAPFVFGDIVFRNYDEYVDTTDYLNTDEARFYPTQVPNLMKRFLAPANFIETVNTMGREFYSKQERLRLDTGVDIHTQTNPLCMCRRPSVLKKGTHS